MKILTLAAAVAGSFVALAAPVHAADLTAQDYVDIQHLYAKYNSTIDSGDAQGWAGTFTPDGVFNRMTGKDALVNFVGAWREKMGGANRRHWNSNLQIAPTADGASGTVYLMLVDVTTKPMTIITTGTYTDTLVKTAEGWRFKTRTTKSDAPPVAPAAAAPAPTPAPAKP